VTDVDGNAAEFACACFDLAGGDAVGTTLQFRPQGSFEPLADRVGCGPFQLQAGQWTDDTSMTLCLARRF
jgi:ADP-ribosyl-[dinitrogen reductase] hydrolase